MLHAISSIDLVIVLKLARESLFHIIYDFELWSYHLIYEFFVLGINVLRYLFINTLQIRSANN